jgi:hypothetical protein
MLLIVQLLTQDFSGLEGDYAVLRTKVPLATSSLHPATPAGYL